jgi:hypothetical protein
VQAALIARLRDALTARYPMDFEASRTRIGGYIEDGLARLLALSAQSELSLSKIEACQAIAATNRRFQFIYGLPNSAGFGAAIGATIEPALFGETRPIVSEITALLNIFMTLLDGLLDEAPEVIAPEFDKLVELVARGSAGEHVGAIETTGDHPFVALCFAVARLWVRKVGEVAALDPRWRERFRHAVARSMVAEREASRSRFENGLPEGPDALLDRTRWPHWCQALVCEAGRRWPARFDRENFRKLIFQIGDYAAYLDDVCDYYIDCRAGQWNSVNLEVFRQSAVPATTPDSIRIHLLLDLADDEKMGRVVDAGVEGRASIERLIAELGAEPTLLNPLVADLTYAYLG